MKRFLVLVGFLVLFSINVEAGETDTYIAEEYQQYCYELGEEYGICPEVLMAMIEKESSGHADARDYKTGTHVGLMQVSQYNAYALEVENIFDPRTNIEVGIKILLDKAEQTEDGDIMSALNYYHGERTSEPTRYSEWILNRSRTLEILHYGM